MATTKTKQRKKKRKKEARKAAAAKNEKKDEHVEMNGTTPSEVEENQSVIHRPKETFHLQSFSYTLIHH